MAWFHHLQVALVLLCIEIHQSHAGTCRFDVQIDGVDVRVETVGPFDDEAAADLLTGLSLRRSYGSLGCDDEACAVSRLVAHARTLGCTTEADCNVLHTIGDSHSSQEHSLWGSVQLPSDEWVLRDHYLGAKLLYSFGRDHVGSDTIATAVNDVDEVALKRKEIWVDLKALGIKRGAAVVFAFGEIDCRSHVAKYVQHPEDMAGVVDALVRSYFAAIRTVVANAGLQAGFDISVGVLGVPPPVFEDGVPPEVLAHTKRWDYPTFVGTPAQRSRCVALMNERFAATAPHFNTTFLSLGDYFRDGGFMDEDTSGASASESYKNHGFNVHITNASAFQPTLTAFLDVHGRMCQNK